MQILGFTLEIMNLNMFFIGSFQKNPSANFELKLETFSIFARFLVKMGHFNAKRQNSLNMSKFHISIGIFSILLFFFSACGSDDQDFARHAAAAAKDPNARSKPEGMAVFRQNCVTCHGADGSLGLNGAKDLSKSVLPLEERINIITHGKNLMTPFGTVLRAEEIQAAAEYTLTLKK